MLWPPPAEVWPIRPPALAAAAGPGGVAARELILVPSRHHPRLLIPAGRQAGAAAIRGYGRPASALADLAARALAGTVGCGLGRLALRDRVQIRVPVGGATIESRLSAMLSQPILVSARLSAARANRKPVLQLITPAGDTVGYAKLGVNVLTSELIRTERTALKWLAEAGLASIRVPRVLASGSWRGHDLIVLSPLPAWHPPVPPQPGQLAMAMAELARAAGTSGAELTASGYWSRLSGRLDSAGAGPDQDVLRVALERMADRAGSAMLRFGTWHGDWTAWNMACTRDGLLVWDWERFGGDVPVGFDALHYWLQEQVVRRRRDPAPAAAECVTRAGELLAPFGMAPEPARLTALLYLADLSLRYLADRQETAGARFGIPRHWLLPALTLAAGGL